MSAASTTALFTAGVTSFWDYVSGLFSPMLLLGLGVAFVGVIFWRIVKSPRHIF